MCLRKCNTGHSVNLLVENHHWIAMSQRFIFTHTQAFQYLPWVLCIAFERLFANEIGFRKGCTITCNKLQQQSHHLHDGGGCCI